MGGMMSARFPVALLLVAVVTAGCASLGGRLEPPHVVLLDLQPLPGSLLAPRYELTLGLRNPNEAPLPLKALHYELRVNDAPFARGFTASVPVVAGYGEAELRVPVTVNGLRVAAQLVRWLEQPPDALEYAITGRVEIKGRRAVPFEQAGNLKLR